MLRNLDKSNRLKLICLWESVSTEVVAITLESHSYTYFATTVYINGTIVMQRTIACTVDSCVCFLLCGWGDDISICFKVALKLQFLLYQLES